ncbi:Uncharacterised protein [Chlamydia trachomatis]|nr:Uncharacterised protein [Chlamydia trachomatis]
MLQRPMERLRQYLQSNRQTQNHHLHPKECAKKLAHDHTSVLLAPFQQAYQARAQAHLA